VVVAFDNTEHVILEQVKFLNTLFLVVYQCIAREICGHNVKGKDGSFRYGDWGGFRV
jgi:hypothetical protein